MRTGLDLDLRHDRVPQHPGDEPGKRLRADSRTTGDCAAGRTTMSAASRMNRASSAPSMERRPPASRHRAEPARISPAADGVVTHTKKLSRIGQPQLRHGTDVSTASAEQAAGACAVTGARIQSTALA